MRGDTTFALGLAQLLLEIVALGLEILDLKPPKRSAAQDDDEQQRNGNRDGPARGFGRLGLPRLLRSLGSGIVLCFRLGIGFGFGFRRVPNYLLAYRTLPGARFTLEEGLCAMGASMDLHTDSWEFAANRSLLPARRATNSRGLV